jgi:hypothetical protein
VRGPPLVLVAWAGLLTVHTAVLVALGGDTLEVALRGGAATGVALLAGLAALLRRDAARVRRVPDLSPPAALAGVALAGLVVGSELGTWLLLIAGGLLVLALAGLVREGRAR